MYHIYNKYKLYAGDEGGGSSPGVGGTAEGGVGESGGGGYSGSSGNGNGAVDAYGNPILTPKSVSIDSNKKIERFYDNKNFRYIEPKGETRTITIKGSEGAGFSLTIKDSSDCSILKNKIENIEIPKKGKYSFQQEFPSILANGTAVRSKEVYTITLTPWADTLLGSSNTAILTQTADPVITISNTSSQTGPALATSGSDITITGRANSSVEYNTAKSYSLTITGSSTETAQSLYIKDTNFSRNITNSTIIKKVIDRCGGTGSIGEISLKPLTTRTTSTIEGGDTISGDLETGMILYAKVEHEKSVEANLDEDGNVLDYNTCKTYPEKFRLDNTNDLTLGMSVNGEVAVGTYISSIDCDKNITLFPKQIIRTDSVLTFKQEWRSTVIDVISNVDSKGNAYISLSNSVDIPDDTEIEFRDSKSSISGTNQFYNSGSDSITLTSYINTASFGDKNVTYTLDLDNMITAKPNAYSQDIIVAKNAGGTTIKMLKFDRDLNASSKTGTVTGGPSHGSVSAYVTSTDSFSYRPHAGFSGEDSFTFTMSDGVTTSDVKKIRITVKK
jgi:hypothetical protein